jgi:CRISPR-associated endoribonuclease Cas6
MKNAIKLYIDLPRNYRSAIIRDRDSVANLLIAAMRVYGYRPQNNQPARWGFGIISEARNKESKNAKQWLHALQRVIVGSSDPDIAAILGQIQPQNLLEPNQVEGAGLDLRMATIYAASPWLETEAASFYCISPIRVTENHPDQKSYASYLETGPKLNQLLNRTMQARFGRKFDLTLIPDSLYVRSQGGEVSASMAIKTRPDGKPIIIKGLNIPFILTGAAEDLHDVWYSGLGRSTARGFGCVEMQQ